MRRGPARSAVHTVTTALLYQKVLRQIDPPNVPWVRALRAAAYQALIPVRAAQKARVPYVPPSLERAFRGWIFAESDDGV